MSKSRTQRILHLMLLIFLLAWVASTWREAVEASRHASASLAQVAEYAETPIAETALRAATASLTRQKNLFLAVQAALLLATVVLISTGLFIARNRHRPMHLRQVLAGYSFIAPAGLHLLLFSLGPILFALYISFHAWGVLTLETPFVGLANYEEALTSRDLWNSLKNTAIYSLHVPLGMAVSLGLALLLNRSKLPGLGLFRTIFYLPSITSFVAIAIVWQWIYNPDFGLFNYGLSLLGIDKQPWLHDPRTALPSLMLMAIWIQAGYQMVIYLAGLQNIPAYLYEAAIIDGAGPWQRFRRITLPMLQPTTFFILVTSMIGSFQVFTQIYVMTEGGPLQATEVIVYYIYKNAWDYLRMGYASAISFVLFVIIMLLTLAQFRLLGRREKWEY